MDRANNPPADEPPPTQPTQPRGIDPKTGKPYEPIEIPVPSEGDVMGLFEKVARAPAEKDSGNEH
jgi:hypothetical protein